MSNRPESIDMPIIGKLIKNTAKITYSRLQNRNKEFYLQVITLVKLLEKAKRTQVGIAYDFKNILLEDDVIDGFQRLVPISDYDQFHDRWLVDAIAGKKDIIWPGRMRHYALSSGTTGSPSKRIPVSTQMIRTFQKTSLAQVSSLHSLDLDEDFFQASILAVGGSTKLTKYPTHIEGDLSGILKKYTPKVATPFAKPSDKIARLKDWNEKLELMVQKAPEWNIGIVAGVPSWCILLMEKVVERYNLEHIHQIWPHFKVYAHGGVFMKPYLSRLQKVLGKEVYTLDTYLASEGYFAYQTHPHRKGMELLIKNSVFFEFVPFNADYFDAQGRLINAHQALTLNEVQEGVDYAMVISTNSGLWRYMIGDLVRFVDAANFEIIITGRIKQFLSLVGEHLSLDNINTAMNEVANKNQLSISEFCIYPKHDFLQHIWFVGSDHMLDEKGFMQEVDDVLKRINDDYASVRKYTLKEPKLHCLPTRYFYQFLEYIGKSGGQHKFPRVLNEKQTAQWLEFLKINGVYEALDS